MSKAKNVIHNTANRSTVVSNGSGPDPVTSGKTAIQTMRGLETEKALATWCANGKINRDRLKLNASDGQHADRGHKHGRRVMIPRKALTDGERNAAKTLLKYTWLFPRHTEG